MDQNKPVSRRDFLKMGGLAALSLPVASMFGKAGEYNLFESPEEYGGFLVRKLDKVQPPYQVSDTYQRFDATNTIFGRMFWDPKVQALLATPPVGKLGDPGWRREDQALAIAAGMLAGYNGGNAGGVSKHLGLFQLDPIGVSMVQVGSALKEPWDHSDKSDEDIANMVKKAAKFYGASLVGIAPLDERWIYSQYYDMNAAVAAPIVFTDVEEVVLPAGKVTPQQAKQLVQEELVKKQPDAVKAFIIDTMSSIDPAALPAGGPPPSMMKALPADQFPGMLPMILGSLPASVITIFSKNLGLDFEIAMVDPGESSHPRYLADDSLAIPKTMKWVIVMAFEMDEDAIDAYPTPLGESGALNGYTRMAVTASTLAEFIRYLGYNAIPCGNMTGLSIPMAIDAGLGELGRQGILITPKYGPRVRLAKVITDLPMAIDQPISFGVKEFCDVCGKCAIDCPSQAISYGAQSDEIVTISTNPGVMKWPLDNEKCFAGWQMAGGDCGNCIRVCPFNKPSNWLHEATRILIGAKAGPIDSLLVKLDTAAGYGGKNNPNDFWKKEKYLHIKE